MATIKKFSGPGFRIDGIDKVIKGLEKSGADVRKASENAIWESGSFLEKQLKRKLSKQGTGRAYLSSMTGKRGLFSGDAGSKKERYNYHIGSVPGQPPALDTGRLRASITHNTTYKSGDTSDGTKLPNPGGNADRVKGFVGTNVIYGYFLEVGAMIWPYGNKKIGKRRLLPRPWFRSTIDENSNKVLKLIIKSLSRAFKSHTGSSFK